MSGRRSRDKGKRGELDARDLLRALGFHGARRGQQYDGLGRADVTDAIPGVHIEVKRTEALSLYKAVEQAQQGASDGEVPVVMHRRSRKPWLVVLPAEDLIAFCCRVVMAKTRTTELPEGDREALEEYDPVPHGKDCRP